jgi:hypothetical protein
MYIPMVIAKMNPIAIIFRLMTEISEHGPDEKIESVIIRGVPAGTIII